MTTVTMSELQEHFTQFLERVAQGEKIVITKDDHPIAVLVPPPPESNQQPKPDVAKVIQEMLEYRDRQKRTLGGISIRELIEEGRRY